MEEIMEIEKKFVFNRFMDRFMEIEKRYNRYEEKLEKREAEGDTEKVKKLEHRMEEMIAEQKGMIEVLEMLGYTIIYQNGIPVIVEDNYYRG